MIYYINMKYLYMKQKYEAFLNMKEKNDIKYFDNAVIINISL